MSDHPGPTPAYVIARVGMLSSGLHVRECPYCNYWFSWRPGLRNHIRDEHPNLPQYRRRTKVGWYDQSTNNR